jgi:hypothetical protein
MRLKVLKGRGEARFLGPAGQRCGVHGAEGAESWETHGPRGGLRVFVRAQLRAEIEWISKREPVAEARIVYPPGWVEPK